MDELEKLPPEYMGLSYEAASREAERLIARNGWFRSIQRLNFLASVMRREDARRQKIEDQP